jgi:competence protein ComEA
MKIINTLRLAILSICLFAPAYVWAQTAEAPKTEETNVEAQVAQTDPGKININTASASDLRTLKGVGKKRAEQIVKDREANGPFTTPQDLTRIKGIGPKTVAKNLDIITVGKPTPPTKETEIKSDIPVK